MRDVRLGAGYILRRLISCLPNMLHTRSAVLWWCLFCFNTEPNSFHPISSVSGHNAHPTTHIQSKYFCNAVLIYVCPLCASIHFHTRTIALAHLRARTDVYEFPSSLSHCQIPFSLMQTRTHTHTCRTHSLAVSVAPGAKTCSFCSFAPLLHN